jgi:hypothetical protein
MAQKYFYIKLGQNWTKIHRNSLKFTEESGIGLRAAAWPATHRTALQSSPFDARRKGTSVAFPSSGESAVTFSSPDG